MRDLSLLYRKADQLLPTQPHLARLIKVRPAEVVAAPLDGMNAHQRRKVRALARLIHRALHEQPPLFPLA